MQVFPFSNGECFTKKGDIWVLRDEILHCDQNDKIGAWYFQLHALGVRSKDGWSLAEAGKHFVDEAFQVVGAGVVHEADHEVVGTGIAEGL